MPETAAGWPAMPWKRICWSNAAPPRYDAGHWRLPDEPPTALHHLEPMKLEGYTTGGFQRGASRAKEAAWWIVRAIFFLNPVPWPSALRVALLRAFGAKIGCDVTIRSWVNITFPWRLETGDHVWFGEEVLILSLAPVRIGSNVCLSQRAFLCTGSHRFTSPGFDLVTLPIVVHDRSWIAAQAFVGPGVEIGPDSMVAAGSIVGKAVPPRVVVQGNPAAVVKELPPQEVPFRTGS